MHTAKRGSRLKKIIFDRLSTTLKKKKTLRVTRQSDKAYYLIHKVQYMFGRRVNRMAKVAPKQRQPQTAIT